jgi:hypothetical protein
MPFEVGNQGAKNVKFEFFQPPKSCHTPRWIFLQSFMKFDERNPNFFQIPPFLFPIFLAYFVPLDVDVTGNIIAKICEVWSEFNIFGHI